MTPIEAPHVFAGNPLDRAEVERRDEAWIEQAKQDKKSRFLPLHRLKVALTRTAEGEAPGGALHWLSREQLDTQHRCSRHYLLGMENGVPHFAADVEEPLEEPADHVFTDSRHAAAALDTPSAGIVAQARAQLHWHAKNGFCAACGNRTHEGRGGQVRICPACDSRIFPRTDPVVIMLVADDTHCLLGQSSMRMPRMKIYSALAGFVDQAESIEEAVRREVREEAGIEAGAVTYHSSQPWPFPSSLMIGCHAEPLTREINFDPAEMADVAWFTRDQVRDAFAGKLDFGLPGKIAIAHHLIVHWLEQE